MVRQEAHCWALAGLRRREGTLQRCRGFSYFKQAGFYGGLRIPKGMGKAALHRRGRVSSLMVFGWYDGTQRERLLLVYSICV